MTCRFNPRTHTGCDLRISRHRPSTVLSFQSTHPHGVRRYVIRRILRRAVVSIHAPTRGATSYIYNRYFAPVVSIHAPTRGATYPLQKKGHSMEFQSTHPHGVRRRSRGYQGTMQGFNPRTHTGCDAFNTSELKWTDDVSIHAPTRGATRPNRLFIHIRRSFNPRTHTGCDLMSPTNTIKPVGVSIHAPTRGATTNSKPLFFISPTFQSTHPHGVRQCAKLHIISQ